MPSVNLTLVALIEQYQIANNYVIVHRSSFFGAPWTFGRYMAGAFVVVVLPCVLTVWISCILARRFEKKKNHVPH